MIAYGLVGSSVFFMVYANVFSVFSCISKLVRVDGSQTERTQIEYERMRVDLCQCASGCHHSHEKKNWRILSQYVSIRMLASNKENVLHH